jgi:multicomponent Na+:H+ antiporter subunit B
MSDTKGKKKFAQRLTAWVNGELTTKDRTLFVMENRQARQRCPYEEHTTREKRRLRKFLGWYPVAASLICLIVVGILLGVVLTMPEFGHPENPTNNEVSQYYLEHPRRTPARKTRSPA